MNNKIIRAGALFALLAVILGAFGAHSIKKMVDDYGIEIWHKAVLYQFIHAFAIIVAGIISIQFPEKHLKRAAVFFTVGIFLFSGSLYMLTFSKISTINLSLVGPLTPIGGLSFIIAWIFMLMAVWQKVPQKNSER